MNNHIEERSDSFFEEDHLRGQDFNHYPNINKNDFDLESISSKESPENKEISFYGLADVENLEDLFKKRYLPQTTVIILQIISNILIGTNERSNKFKSDAL